MTKIEEKKCEKMLELFKSYIGSEIYVAKIELGYVILQYLYKDSFEVVTLCNNANAIFDYFMYEVESNFLCKMCKTNGCDSLETAESSLSMEQIKQREQIRNFYCNSKEKINNIT